jgi:hypothetical protein
MTNLNPIFSIKFTPNGTLYISDSLNRIIQMHIRLSKNNTVRNIQDTYYTDSNNTIRNVPDSYYTNSYYYADSPNANGLAIIPTTTHMPLFTTTTIPGTTSFALTQNLLTRPNTYDTYKISSTLAVINQIAQGAIRSSYISPFTGVMYVYSTGRVDGYLELTATTSAVKQDDLSLSYNFGGVASMTTDRNRNLYLASNTYNKIYKWKIMLKILKTSITIIYKKC